MCNALDITPIITTYCGITPEEYADLVEYMWGSADTDMGRLRVKDGHPGPYKATFIEVLEGLEWVLGCGVTPRSSRVRRDGSVF